MIPRRFFWLFDVFILSAAFFLAYFIVPRIPPLFLAGGPLHISWLKILSLPPAEWVGTLPHYSYLLWILLTTIPATIMVMEILGGYRPLFEQSRTRILINSLASPTIGLGFIAPVLIVFKKHQYGAGFFPFY